MQEICQSIRQVSDWACPDRPSGVSYSAWKREPVCTLLVAAQAGGNVHCNLSRVQHAETEINISVPEKIHENTAAIQA